jgi:hypothetical protein
MKVPSSSPIRVGLQNRARTIADRGSRPNVWDSAESYEREHQTTTARHLSTTEHYQFRNNPYSRFSPQVLSLGIFVIKLKGMFQFPTIHHRSSTIPCGIKNRSLHEAACTLTAKCSSDYGHWCLQSTVRVTWVACMHPAVGEFWFKERWVDLRKSCCSGTGNLSEVNDWRNGRFMNSQATSKVGMQMFRMLSRS